MLTPDRKPCVNRVTAPAVVMRPTVSSEVSVYQSAPSGPADEAERPRPGDERELGHGARRRDPPDPAGVALGEPDVAVGAARDVERLAR